MIENGGEYATTKKSEKQKIQWIKMGKFAEAVVGTDSCKWTFENIIDVDGSKSYIAIFEHRVGLEEGGREWLGFSLKQRNDR